MHDTGDYNVSDLAAVFSIAWPIVSRTLQRTPGGRVALRGPIVRGARGPAWEVCAMMNGDVTGIAKDLSERRLTAQQERNVPR